jgi:hypothetical protein
MASPERIEIDRHGGKAYIIVGNDVYCGDFMSTQRKNKGHISKLFFKKIDPVKHEERIEKIIDQLEAHINPRNVLRGILADASMQKLDMIERRLKKKAKIKEVQGCYGLMLGDMEIPIVE